MNGRNAPPFVRQSLPASTAYVGSRWWNQMLEERHAAQGRRRVLWGLGITGGVGALMAAQFFLRDGSDDGIETPSDALELQRRTSWNVGGTDRPLSFAGACRTDVDGGPAWQAPLADGHLDDALRPVETRLQPYYDPALFQAPAAPTAQGLKAVLSPISTPATQAAFLRGQALAALLRGSDSPPGVGIIVDVPGPEAVAVAAGLAEVAAPVFTFANWPHPLGVVSSHLTLASALYYLPLFRRMDVTRPAGAPPAFILDANRLAPYRDEAGDFDNRYLVNLPSPDSLRELGIQRLLYVRPDGNDLRELDDLNSDLLAYQQGGIEVRGLALADFRPDGETPPARDAGVSTPTTERPRYAGYAVHRPYFWGGWSAGRSVFWSYYGWGPHASAPRASPSLKISSANTYRPTPRPTMFSVAAMGPAGIGKQKPSGFGRVWVRTARGTGAVTRVGSGRSGSFGRTRFSSGSG